MPTYSYACKECGHAFDIQQAFSDDALTTCPECGGPLKKVFSAVGVVFKGSGFYRTDSGASSAKSKASGTTKSSPTSSTPSSPSQSSSTPSGPSQSSSTSSS